MVVFDFDRTLTRCDSSAQFFRWLLRREAWRRFGLLLIAATLGPLMLTRRTRRYPVRTAVWLATFGRSQHELAELAELHVTELRRQQPSLLMEDARQCVLEHLRQGDQVVIATGSLRVLVDAILRAEQLVVPQVFGSSLRHMLGGMVADEYCFGRHKPVVLAAASIHAPYAVVYSDHSDDLPLFERARRRFIINPKPGCATRLSAALQGSGEVLHWR